VDNNFNTPNILSSKDKAPVSKKNRDLAKKADTIWLASERDREGEA